MESWSQCNTITQRRVGDHKITVLTCTFNRAELLNRLYLSLHYQTDFDFDWLVIDDGSQDHTRDVIQECQQAETNFQIRYIWQENGGKHRAINRAMQEQELGEYIFLVDSDDEITPDAIETIKKWIEQIAGKERFAGVAGQCVERNNNKVVGKFPKGHDYIDASNIERYKRKLTGDKAEVYRTELLRKYAFPEYEGEKFITEGVIWNQIAMDGYQLRWFPKGIYICQYLEGGLTKDEEKWCRNWKGFTESTLVSMRAYRGMYRFRAIAKYIRYAKKKDLQCDEVVKKIHVSKVEYCIANVLQSVYWR